MEIKTEKLSSTDLTAINKITFKDFAEEQVFVFSAKFIDDQPTANGRIWSKEWQVKNVGQFVGLPVTVNHENDQTLVMGRIFAAKQENNAITGKVFVPLISDAHRETRDKIEAGLFKSVSINASASNTEREGKHTRILPGDDDRVFEVSFVAVPGCKSCEVVATENLCVCPTEEEPVKSEQVTSQWVEFAQSAHREASSTYIRLAGLLFTESFERTAYEKVAEALDPASLKTLSDDLRQLHEERGEREAVAVSPAQQVKEQLSKIKAMKGI